MSENNGPLGQLPRFDYTHTKAQALASEENGTIFFTTDGFIVFNGEVWTKNAPVNIYQHMTNGEPTNFRKSDGSIELPAYPQQALTGVKGDAEGVYRTGNVNITKANIGLGNVTNDAQIPATEKGAAGGVATLGSNGKIPSSQLPGGIDDVIEGYMYGSDMYRSSTGNSSDFVPANKITPESDKLYIDLSTNKTFRWGGTVYTEVSASLVLGETSSTAYRGDRGKTAYDHAVAKGSAYASGLYKITTNSEGHVTGATAVQKSDITALGVPSQDSQVTSPAYHYAPETDSYSTLDATSGETSDNFVVQKILRDAKGHVTGIVKKLITVDVSGKQDKSNLVTSWGNTPSDAKYPSEKLVYDELDAIKTQLNALKWK
jgi:hypothetical protein